MVWLVQVDNSETQFFPEKIYQRQVTKLGLSECKLVKNFMNFFIDISACSSYWIRSFIFPALDPLLSSSNRVRRVQKAIHLRERM